MSFELHRPREIAEAAALLAVHGEDAVVLAGGTAFALLWKQGLIRPAHVVDLHALAGLRRVVRTPDGGLHLGALATHRDIERSPAVASFCPAVAETFARIATPRIRGQGTVGGSLAHADPAQDPPVILLVLDATVETSDGEVHLADFFRGMFDTVLGARILTGVRIPPLPPGTRAAFHKFLPRTADDYATVSVAVARLPDAAVRVALGGVAATPVRARPVERAVAEGAGAREAAALVAETIDPVDDARGSAAYKRRMARVWTERALTAVLT